MDGSNTGREVAEPLTSRLPRYVAWAATLLVGGVLAGFTAGALFDAAARDAVGWTWLILGAGLLLIGGTSGGGLSLQKGSAYGIHYGSHHDKGLNDADAEIARVQDLRERAARNLRPKANPTAYWQVVGGLLLSGLGALVATAG